MKVLIKVQADRDNKNPPYVEGHINETKVDLLTTYIEEDEKVIDVVVNGVSSLIKWDQTIYNRLVEILDSRYNEEIDNNLSV